MGRRNTEETFWNRVKKTSKCWNWQGATTKTGYGLLSFDSKLQYAHRLSYTFTNGAIKEKMHILHRCDNPQCVNPEHLFQGTNFDNVKDKMKKKRHHCQKKTHCIHGHEFSKNNTYINPKNNHRFCRACLLRRSRERRRRLKNGE